MAKHVTRKTPRLDPKRAPERKRADLARRAARMGKAWARGTYAPAFVEAF